MMMNSDPPYIDTIGKFFFASRYSGVSDVDGWAEL